MGTSRRNQFTDRYLLRKVTAVLESKHDRLHAGHKALGLILQEIDHLVSIGVYEIDGGRIETIARRGRRDLEEIPHVDGWVRGNAAVRGAPLLVQNLQGQRRFRPAHPNARSEIGVPILFGNRVLGEIHASSDYEYAFSNEDIELLTAVSEPFSAFLTGLASA